MPLCRRAVWAIEMVLHSTASITMGQKVNLYVPHAVATLVDSTKAQHVTGARWTNWELTLNGENLQFHKNGDLNPASLMLLHGEGESHTCDPDQITPKPRPDSQETALESGKVLYTDGSSNMTTKKEESNGVRCVW